MLAVVIFILLGLGFVYTFYKEGQSLGCTSPLFHICDNTMADGVRDRLIRGATVNGWRMVWVQYHLLDDGFELNVTIKVHERQLILGIRLNTPPAS